MSREESVDDEDYDIGYGDDSGLFWKMTLKPNQPTEIDQPAIPGYIVHVTNACYGVDVKQKSRSVVMVNTSEDGSEPSDEAPICVLLQGSHENQQLDLLFNESATITVKGTKPSAVTLTGYLQPPVTPGDDMDPAMMEDMDEEQIEAMLKAQKKQAMALDDEEDEDEDEDEPELDDEDDVSPPNKKQKTGETTSKATKNGGNAKDKKRKEAAKKQQKSPQSDNKKGNKKDNKKDNKQDNKKDNKKEDKKDDNKQESKKKKGKDKKMQNMKGGIKFRDMKVGDGATIKHGDKVRVYYVGQLDDKKVFDKCISGNGFEFNYGKGDVIKGWDMGIKGMKVGGKRKLVIPPKLGYGASGSPPTIGANATLTFTIELKGVN